MEMSLDRVAKKESESVHYLIILIALWALLGGFYMFLNGHILYSWLHINQHEPVIAQISHSKDDVRKRFGSDLVWFPAVKRDLVYNNDVVFTGEESITAITFQDGTMIAVGPTSLVLLKMEDGIPNIKVGHGSVILKLAKGSAAKLDLNGEVTTMEGNGSASRFVALGSRAKDPLTAQYRAPDEFIFARGSALDPLDSSRWPASWESTKSELPPLVAGEGIRPFELILNSSLIFSAKSFFLGGLGFQTWVSDIVGKNATGSQIERMGLYAKYMNSIPGGIDSQGFPIETGTTNIDLKYKLLDGTWNRDEIAGLSLAYQRVSYRILSAHQLGVGAFWGRKLPKWWDDILNYVPIWRYPKWLEAEFQYYPYSPEQSISLGPSFNLSISGKLYFRPTYFLFGSLGYYQYSYQDIEREGIGVEVKAGHGTGGIGVNF